MIKDNLFEDDDLAAKPFEFTEDVAKVFDDMAERSIPFYTHVQEQTVDLVSSFIKEDETIYDLGCATGNTLAYLIKGLKKIGYKNLIIYGVDYSAPMCKLAEKKLSGLDHPYNVNLITSDIAEVKLINPKVVILNYTLHFVPPKARPGFLKSIYKALAPGGIILVSDKSVQASEPMTNIFAEHYHDYKRKNGYSEKEIKNKANALKSILRPYSIDEAYDLYRNAGFEEVDLFFSWYNFTSYICRKKP